MDLILWRHAEAEEGESGQSDASRRLTPHGRNQALHVARWLLRRLPDKHRILVSPAVRTQQTADALGLAYEIEASVGTAAAAGELLAAAGWPEGKGTILVVGHQPTLGHVAARLLGAGDADWSVRKGAVWWLSRRKRGDGQTVLRAVIDPDWVND